MRALINAYHLASYGRGSSNGPQPAGRRNRTHPSSGPPAGGSRVTAGQRGGPCGTAPKSRNRSGSDEPGFTGMGQFL